MSEKYNPERMGFVRKTIDKAITVGNTIDLGAIAIGVIISNYTLAVAGGLSFLVGKSRKKNSASSQHKKLNFAKIMI